MRSLTTRSVPCLRILRASLLILAPPVAGILAAPRTLAQEPPRAGAAVAEDEGRAAILAALAEGRSDTALALASRRLHEAGESGANRMLLARAALAEAERRLSEGASEKDVALLRLDAEDSARRAFADSRTFVEAGALLGFLHTDAARYAEAARVLDEVLARAPDDADALALRGFVHLRRGEPDQAVKVLDRAIAQAPDRVAPRVHRASALAALDPARGMEAFVELERSGSADEGVPRDAYDTFANDPAWAVRTLDAMTNARPSATTWYWLAMARSRAGDGTGSIAAMDAALALAPENAELLMARAELLREKGDVKGYVDALLPIARQDDDAGETARQRLALTAGWFGENRRWEEVLALENALIELQPDEVAHAANRALALHKLDRDAESEAAYRAALARFPDEAALWNDYGLLLHATGRFAEALAAYARSAADDSDAIENRGMLRLALGEFEAARDDALAVLDQEPARVRSIHVLVRALDALHPRDAGAQRPGDAAAGH